MVRSPIAYDKPFAQVSAWPRNRTGDVPRTVRLYQTAQVNEQRTGGAGSYANFQFSKTKRPLVVLRQTNWHKADFKPRRERMLASGSSGLPNCGETVRVAPIKRFHLPDFICGHQPFG